jgi:sporulation protein YlmC with PRC-barrel domain
MKRSIALTVVFCLGLPLLGSAQNRPGDERGRPSPQPGSQQHQSQPQPQRDQEGRAAQPLQTVKRASELLSSMVENPQGEHLGRIDEVVVNLQAGRVTYAVLNSGGLQGVGGKLLAIPSRALSVSDQEGTLLLNITRQELARAPGFDRENWPDMANPQWAAQDGITRQQDLPFADRQTGRTEGGMVDERPQIQRVNELLGLPVRHQQGRILGELQDLLLDLEEGRVLYVVLRTEGFVRGGHEYQPIPSQLVTFSPRQDELLASVDMQRVRQGPGFSGPQWPDLADPRWSEQVYRFYGLQPYWTVARAEPQIREPAGARQPSPPDRRQQDPNETERFQQQQAPDQNRTPRGQLRHPQLQQITATVATQPGHTWDGLGSDLRAPIPRWHQDSEWPPQADERADQRERREHRTQQQLRDDRLERITRASDLRGTSVVNHRDQNLGEIRDVVVDLEAGRVVYFVLGTGGFLGLRERYFAIPPQAFEISRGDDWELLLPVEEQQISEAPGFDRNEWPIMANPRWAAQAYRFYGQQPHWQAEGRAGSEFREPAGAPRTQQAPPRGRNGNQPYPNGRASQGQPRGGALLQDEGIGRIARVSDLRGTTIRNHQGENLGDIRDVVVDLHSGRVVYLALAAGGFLGLGERYFAIAPELVQLSPRDERVLLLNIDRQRIAQAPGFTRDQWPVEANPQWLRMAGARFQQQPGQHQTWERGQAPGQSPIRQGEPEARYNEQRQPQTRGTLRDDRLDQVTRATDLRGTQVVNHRNEQLGDIRDVVVDIENGRVVYLVFGAGGFLGLGERYFAIPPRAFRISHQNDWELILPIDQRQIAQAPGFDRDNWPIMANPRWAEEAYRFYGQQPHWQTARRGAFDVQEPAGAPRMPRQGNGYDREREHQFQGDPGRTPRGGIEHGGGLFHDEGIGRIARGSDLRGTRVVNHRDQELGEIRDLVLDIQNGRIVYVALGAGGFLGLGERYFAIPPEAIRISPHDDRELLLAIEANRIAQAQGFSRDNWPAQADQRWAEEAWVYYRQHEWEQQRQSGREIRDPAGAGREAQPQFRQISGPRDQGRAENDRGMTQQIRRALVTDQTLSTAAKNVNIHVSGGMVTLKGQVNSEEEKQVVESKAREIAGPQQVQSQIEVRERRSR